MARTARRVAAVAAGSALVSGLFFAGATGASAATEQASPRSGNTAVSDGSDWYDHDWYDHDWYDHDDDNGLINVGGINVGVLG